MMVPNQVNVLENLGIKDVKLAEPKSFLKIGDIGELNGRYFRLECIDNLKHMAYFTEIKIHKLRIYDNGVGVVE